VKVLVIGSGGREHALVWKLSQSKHINKIYASPGNAGMAEIAECIDLSPNDVHAITDFVKYEWIDLTIVCSAKFLAAGIADFFEREGRKILGPRKKAAHVGLSRVFAKKLLRLYGIPTAEYKVFTSHLHAKDYIRLKGAPIVIKTDGCPEGTGCFLVSTTEEATNILKLIMEDRIFGDAGKHVVIEEQLRGERLSFVALTDGKTITPLTSLRIYRGNDTNPDAIGMGAYSPVYSVKKELETNILGKIMGPLIEAFHSEGINHRGFISADLVVDEEKAHVFELNCCLGDLESQTALPRLKTDFVDMVLAVTEERLADVDIEMEENPTVCIASALEGYPKSRNGAIISGLEKIKAMKDVIVFHENTSFSDSEIVASSGRAIDITAFGKDLEDAKTKAYRAMREIRFDGMYYRKDIGT